MNETISIVGIRYKRAGRIYSFDPAGIELKANDYVVVSTPRGLKLGQVVNAPHQVLSSELPEPPKPIVRKATPEDIKRAEEFGDKEIEVLAEAAQQVTKLNLPMKLIMAEYNLEGNHLTIYFKAAERVDFRELVKELNSHFKLRVELRQVGPRDEAKLVGGYGRCGRPLCCASFLNEFAPVSIKMAKQQNLPLNPMKIAGSCGRLLCCLSYEADPSLKVKAKPTATSDMPAEEAIETSEEIPVEEIARDKEPEEPGNVIDTGTDNPPPAA
ncbi:MAG: stage 0 sporulation family protein [Dehalococcoidales bacterium]|nr:stage 0 sporulation family protein [Dehalococcoidales bacterium]